MDINRLVHLTAVVLVMLIGLGMVTGIIRSGNIFRWIFCLVVLIMMVPLLKTVQQRYGNPGLVVAASAGIVIVMYRFQFTRQILVQVLSAAIYNQFIRWILYFTGAAAFLYWLAYKVSRWITE